MRVCVTVLCVSRCCVLCVVCVLHVSVYLMCVSARACVMVCVCTSGYGVLCACANVCLPGYTQREEPRAVIVMDVPQSGHRFDLFSSCKSPLSGKDLIPSSLAKTSMNT